MASFNSYASIGPATAIFQSNDAARPFTFWFRGFPDNFQTLTAGIQPGRYYFFPTPAGQEIPMD